MGKRRGTKKPGTQAIIQVDEQSAESFHLAARRENITFDLCIERFVNGRLTLRAELLKLDRFKNRLVSMGEGHAALLSLVREEVVREEDAKLQEQSEYQSRSTQSNHMELDQ